MDLRRAAQGGGFAFVVADVAEQAVPGFGVGGQVAAGAIEIGEQRCDIRVTLAGVGVAQAIQNGLQEPA